MGKIFEENKFDVAFVPGQLSGAGKTSTVYVTMLDAERIAVVAGAHIHARDTLTVQFKQATSSAGAGVKVLGSAITFQNTGAHRDIVGRAEVKATDLDAANGFIYVGVTVSTGESATGSGIFIRSDLGEKDSAVQAHETTLSVTTTHAAEWTTAAPTTAAPTTTPAG